LEYDTPIRLYLHGDMQGTAILGQIRFMGLRKHWDKFDMMHLSHIVEQRLGRKPTAYMYLTMYCCVHSLSITYLYFPCKIKNLLHHDCRNESLENNHITVQ
jgi:hypothetical protein